MNGNSKKFPSLGKKQNHHLPGCITEDSLLDQNDFELIYGPSQSECLDEPVEVFSEDLVKHQMIVEQALEGKQDSIIEVYKQLVRHLQSGDALPYPYKEYFSFVTSQLIGSNDCRVLLGFAPGKKTGPKEQNYKKMLIAQLVMYCCDIKGMKVKEAIPYLAMMLDYSESTVEKAYEQYRSEIAHKCLYHHSFNKSGSGLAQFSESYILPLIEKIKQNTVTIFDVYPIN